MLVERTGLIEEAEVVVSRKDAKLQRKTPQEPLAAWRLGARSYARMFSSFTQHLLPIPFTAPWS
jgi:hypothetical protein